MIKYSFATAAVMLVAGCSGNNDTNNNINDENDTDNTVYSPEELLEQVIAAYE